MKKLCDLHTHSTFSDGTFTPEEIIEAAIRSNLSAIALCDHNTVDGIPRFLNAAKGKQIDAVAGCEFSVDFEGTELHMLGLFIPEIYLNDVSSLMTEINQRKELSNIELVNSLSKIGITLNYDEIKNATPTGKVNRAHIAASLTEKGYTKSVKEAFASLLSPAAGHYKEPKRLTVWEIIDFIVSIKATPVLAHPFLNLSSHQLEAFLPKAKECGVVGMECLYSLYDEPTTLSALDLTKRFGLKPSGGSDFHGAIKPDIKLGIGKGNLTIPYEWYLNLKNN